MNENTVHDWITTAWPAVGFVALSAVGVYLVVIALTRLVGLRSFSKMSSFDFAMTVAIGSMISSVVLLRDVPLLLGAAGLAAVYVIQLVAGRLRTRFTALERLMGNEPILLMAGRDVLHDNLRKARVTPSDLRAKLREAGVTSLDEVCAVVFETTGDVSVIKGEGPLDPALFKGVRGAEALGPAFVEASEASGAWVEASARASEASAKTSAEAPGRG